MKKPFSKLIIAAVVIIGVIIAGPFYVVEEGQQAVIVRFGEIVNVQTQAGLNFKVPIIDDVIRYPKRIMAWDGEANLMPTREKQYIFVDVTARWRINDPEKFYVSIRTLNAAYSRLGEVIDSEVRTVIAENYMRESVRSSNHLRYRVATPDDLGLGDEIDLSILGAAILSESRHEPIERGRRELAEEILYRSRQVVPEFGIELIDVVIRQIRYSDELTPSVYARMIKEREQIAQAIRSEGEGRRAEWLGRMENEKRTILSAAYEQSETIRGIADAEAARIYADAFSGPAASSFFTFWRAMESYRQVIPMFNKVLTTDMDFFRYLYNPR